MGRRYGIDEMTIVETSLSVFRTMESSCLRGCFSDNPLSIVRITYSGKFLCYGVSSELVHKLDSTLFEIDREEWVDSWVKMEIGLTCWRGGSAQLLSSVICSGAKTNDILPRSVVKVLENGRHSQRTFYLVPPCVAFAIYGPVLFKQGRGWKETVLRLRAPKREVYPTQVEELLERLEELKISLAPESKAYVEEITAKVESYVEALADLESKREGLKEAIEVYLTHRLSKDYSLPRIATTPKVFGLEICDDGEREFFKITT